MNCWKANFIRLFKNLLLYLYYNKFNSYSMKIGDKFNDWTVIDDKSINRNGATMYLCRCKCGKEQYVQV